jgi:hypothetical protein
MTKRVGGRRLKSRIDEARPIAQRQAGTIRTYQAEIADRAAAPAPATIDEFGLPVEWSLLETTPERQKREAAALAVLERAVQTALRHLDTAVVTEAVKRLTRPVRLGGTEKRRKASYASMTR